MGSDNWNPKPFEIVVAVINMLHYSGSCVMAIFSINKPERLIPSGDETEKPGRQISGRIDGVSAVGSETDTDTQNGETHVKRDKR